MSRLPAKTAPAKSLAGVRSIAFQSVSGLLLLCLLRFCWLPQYVLVKRAPDELPRITPNEWLGLAITVVLILVVSIPIYRFALFIARKRKQRLLDVYLQQSSPLRVFLKGNAFAHAKAAATAAIFAPVAYLACYSYGLAEIAGITICMASALIAAASLNKALIPQIVPARLALVRINTFLLVGVLSSVMWLATLKLVNDSSIISAKIADEAIKKEVMQINHPVHAIEVVLRGQKYFDLYLLRARGKLPGGIGILLYLFFFLPAGLPLLAIAYAFGGTSYELT